MGVFEVGLGSICVRVFLGISTRVGGGGSGVGASVMGSGAAGWPKYFLCLRKSLKVV